MTKSKWSFTTKRETKKDSLFLWKKSWFDESHITTTESTCLLDLKSLLLPLALTLLISCIHTNTAALRYQNFSYTRNRKAVHTLKTPRTLALLLELTDVCLTVSKVSRRPKGTAQKPQGCFSFLPVCFLLQLLLPMPWWWWWRPLNIFYASI